MCTAVTYKAESFYFGRTLDYERSFGEEVVIAPRGFDFGFDAAGGALSGAGSGGGYAIIGMAHVARADDKTARAADKTARAAEKQAEKCADYPLFYDALNEKGLCMAGLNFVGNAVYGRPQEGRDNLAQYELIPWILCQCASVAQARRLLERLNITDTPFSATLPPAQLHWIIADESEAITVEAVAAGLKIYENKVGVLTNNPTFDKQLAGLNDYMGLSAANPPNRFSADLALAPDCLGMGALGLPGDWSSKSRFVRAAFVRANSDPGLEKAGGQSGQESAEERERRSVNQFFHIMDTVAQPRGCNVASEAKGLYEMTIYTSCCNAKRGIYYYTTYEDRTIRAVKLDDLTEGELAASALVRRPLAGE